MFETIHRPYKERTASQTVALLKDKLAQLELLPQEVMRNSPYPGLFSVCLELPAAMGGFSANGKGRTLEYCLASGYAEFTERVQNGLFATFPRTIVAGFRERYGYYIMPDEQYLAWEEFIGLPAPIMTDIVRYNSAGQVEFMAAYYARVRANGAPGVVAVPFYDTQRKQVTALPLNLLLLTVGSNGMAAGNTMPEAIYQGLCELLERWAAAETFFGRLTPPTVPGGFLKQFKPELEIIEAIEASGKYRVSIKDFSAGRHIPALGILVENLQAGTYRLNVGCDTCFQVTLSRCLTEVYQGLPNEAAFDGAALPLPTEDPWWFVQDDPAALYMRHSVFSQFTTDNRALFPISLFAGEPSYPFDPATWTDRSSYAEEVQRLVSFFHGLGHNVYLRDVSFLGFPSVLCYVPEVSALGRKNVPAPVFDHSPIMLELDVIESRALKLKSCADADLAEVAAVLEKLPPGLSLAQVFGIKLRPESPWTQYNLAFLLSQIWYRLGCLDRARDALEVFLKLREGDENPYYELVRRYLQRRASGCSAEEAGQALADDPRLADLARTVAEDLADGAAIFHFVKLPNCPDCATCELMDDCLTRGRLTMMDIVRKAMVGHRSDQADLRWVC
jgi:ribosomal protein S12 methylthiotransferase accessory factor